jgi:hypothetical protein
MLRSQAWPATANTLDAAHINKSQKLRRVVLFSAGDTKGERVT